MQGEEHDLRVAETRALTADMGSASAVLVQQRQKALARWDNDGGAGPDGPQSQNNPESDNNPAVQMTSGDLDQLRVRVIALENLLIAVLAEGSGRQLEQAMATMNSSHPEFTRHPLAIQAADQMRRLVERASQQTTPEATSASAEPHKQTGDGE